MPVAREPDLTLFAAIRIDRDRPVSDLDRFIALALPSLDGFLSRELVRELVVAVPPSDVRETTARLRGATNFPVRVVDERQLVGRLDGTAGWIKQQIIKLGAPEVIRTPWYITLDADVVATRPLDRDFLLPGDRAIWEQEPYSAHWTWWEASAKMLGQSPPPDPDAAAFGVTPAILHTESVRGLARAIELRYPGRSWIGSLTELHNRGWTEYTLYWSYVVAAGLAGELYAEVDRVPYSLDGSVWSAEGFGSLDLKTAFAPGANHAFFVFQSNLELSLESTVELLRPAFRADAAVTAGERRQWARHSRRYDFRRIRRRIVARLRRAIGR